MTIGKVQGSAGFAPASSQLPKDVAEFKSPTDATGAGASDMMEYLKVMAEMQAESRKFTLLSQILTMRHDAAKSAAKNIH